MSRNYQSYINFLRLNLPNLKDITLPAEVPLKTLKSKLNEKILSGEYNIGQLIVPQVFQKTSIKDNTVVTEEFTVEGRKILLHDIRKKMLHDHQNYMRLHTDEEIESFDLITLTEMLKKKKDFSVEKSISLTKLDLQNLLKKYERTRYLMFWHDGSCISNHGHIMMMVSCMYDDGAFVTDQEYQPEHGCLQNIQSIVEKPYVYLLARCPSDDHQLLYSQERINDILELSRKIEFHGIEITDVMPIFKGDNPAFQFESGQQKNGDYFCWQCPLFAPLSPSIVHAMSLPHLSLSDRISKVRSTQASVSKLKRNLLKLYSNLKKDEVVQELHERKVSFTCNSSAKELQELLIKEMHGIQRLPALLFQNPTDNLDELFLQHYEILNNEPLHDVSHHTQNLYEEIPNHLPKVFKQSLKKIIYNSFNGKEAKNSSNYRESLLILCVWLSENHPRHFATEIFTTLVEIQEILYATDQHRNRASILRLQNICFKHAMLLKIHLQVCLKSLTSRKLFGSYYHSLIIHAPQQYRLVSGRTSNTESEEATSTHNLSIPTLATSNAVATNSSTLENTSNVSLLQSPEVHKVSQICSPPQNIDFFCDNRRTQLPVHPDTPNAKKPSHVTSTPLTKSKKNEEVLLFVQKFPLDNSKQVLYSKSSAKLIKLLGEKEFIKSFDKARKKAKSCNSVANIKEYKAELATIKVKISNLRRLMKEKLKTMEREILMTSDDINLQPTKIHEKEYNDIIKTLQYIEILWKELEL